MNPRFPRKYWKLWEVGGKTETQTICDNMGIPVICVYLFVWPGAPSKRRPRRRRPVSKATGFPEATDTKLSSDRKAADHSRWNDLRGARDQRQGRPRTNPLYTLGDA
eukprot:6706387-Pyramimonas_sp.AAC.1